MEADLNLIRNDMTTLQAKYIHMKEISANHFAKLSQKLHYLLMDNLGDTQKHKIGSLPTPADATTNDKQDASDLDRISNSLPNELQKNSETSTQKIPNIFTSGTTSEIAIYI